MGQLAIRSLPLVLVSLIAAAAPATALAVSFTAPIHLTAGNNPAAVVAGDFNGDRDPDLAAVNSLSHDVSVLVGGAGASFTGPTNFAVGGTEQTALATGNFNADADADPDLAVLADGPDVAAVLLGSAEASFEPPTTFDVGNNSGGRAPQGIAVGFFNADGDPDLVVAHGGAVVLLGDTGGSFVTQPTLPTANAPRSVAVADFNGDSKSDLAVAAASGDANVSILHGNGDGSFGTARHFSLGNFPPDSEPEIAVADFNGDSDPDLVVTRHGDVLVLLGGTDPFDPMAPSFGTPTTLDLAGEGPGSVAVSEFNADSDPDLAVANAYSGDVSVLLGGAGASFGAETRFAVAGGPRSLAIGDFNDDEDPDLAIANSGPSRVSLLLNRAHAPAPPTFGASSPASPANDNAPKLTGTAPAGTTVRLYASADCSGSPAATGSAAEFAAPGLTVAVPDDSTTAFRATATNAADVPSDCSTSQLSYIEHSSPPKAALSVSPNPVLTGAGVGFDASSTTGFGITRYEWDLDGDETFETDTGPVPSTGRSFAAPADINPGVRVSNDLGSSVARVPLSIRLAPPSGPVGVSIVALDGDRRFTNVRQVNVVAVWPPLTRTLLVSNDGGFADAGSFPVAPRTPWVLDSLGSERLPKTVYVRFDGSTQTFSDDIILDETAPAVTAASLGGGASQSAVAARTARYRIRLKARDNASGVARFQIGGKGRKTSRPRRLGKARRTLARTISVRSSFTPRRIRVQDAAGNWSRWKRIAKRQ